MSREERAQSRRIKKARARRRAFSLISLLLIASLVLCFWPVKEKEEALPEEPETVSLSLMCLGDVMTHSAQLDSCKKSDGSYDFSEWFEYIADYTQNADVCLANIETTFKGVPPYTGYPAFNAPDVLLDNLKDIGVDVCLLSNNHMLDGGAKSLLRGMNLMREKGFVTCGVQNAGESRYSIIESKGLKIGIVSYSYETPAQGGRRCLQGNPMSAEALEICNTFGYENNDADMKNIEDRMQEARDAGADIVVLYMHWGEEYQNSANIWQRKMAQELATHGADIVFASHPHVPQEVTSFDSTLKYEIIRVPEPVEEEPDPFLIRFRKAVGLIKEEEEEPEVLPETWTKSVPVFYSLGNCISNQRQETLGNRYTEEGLIAGVNLTYEWRSGAITYDDVYCIPTWVEKYSPSGVKYTLIPLLSGYESNPDLVAAGHVARAKQALADMTKLIGEEYLYKGTVY